MTDEPPVAGRQEAFAFRSIELIVGNTMKKQSGITLIELMIVVVIIGILATIALPSYRQYIERTRAGDAQSALMSLANAMERYHTQNGTYVGAAVGTGGIFPAEAPLDGDNKFYDLKIESATVNAYELLAEAKNGQGGGNIGLDSTGLRTNWQ